MCGALPGAGMASREEALASSEGAWGAEERRAAVGRSGTEWDGVGGSATEWSGAEERSAAHPQPPPKALRTPQCHAALRPRREGE